MEEARERALSFARALRLALVLFVLLWIFGPYELRAAVPIWIPFAAALGLELQLLYSAFRDPSPPLLDRRPQARDRERFGYDDDESSEMLLVHDEGRELWIAYDGETDEELKELVAAAREQADAEESAPPLPAASPPDRGPSWPAVRRFLTGVAIFGALALTAWVVESRTGWGSVDGDARVAAVERFSDEASRIAGKPAQIRCDESRDYVGFVQHADGVALVGGDRAYLTPEICHDLYRLAFDGENRGNPTGRAVAVLAHESWHLQGVSDEGTTECYALQSGVELGTRLGLSEERARQLMRQQLTENALRGAASSEYRVSPDCRDGGPLDLRPADDSFP